MLLLKIEIIFMYTITELKQKYSKKKKDIDKKLDEFREIFKESDKRVFEELAFCLCTPQSKATASWSAILSLKKNNLLYKGNFNQIKPFLNTVRFNETKAKRIVLARSIFMKNGKILIKNKISSLKNSKLMREWLIENINGFGPKESSHFLRNIGFGNNLTILDVHILRNLKKYGVIEEIPSSMTHKKYYEIEEKMKKFSKKIKIPLDALDLLFWSEQTGIIFK